MNSMTPINAPYQLGNCSFCHPYNGSYKPIRITGMGCCGVTVTNRKETRTLWVLSFTSPFSTIPSYHLHLAWWSFNPTFDGAKIRPRVEISPGEQCYASNTFNQKMMVLFNM